MTVPVPATVIDRAGNSLGEYLPRLGAALLVLLAGLLLAALVRRVLTRVLTRVGVDRAAERLGIHEVLTRAGLERSLARLVAFVARVALTVVTLIATVAVLRIDALDRTLNEVLLFLPRLLAALLLVLAGLVAAGIARERIDRATYQMDIPGPLGRVAQASILTIAVITALAQIGVPTLVLTLLVAAVAFGAVLTFALAFGLGSRDVARQLSAGRSLAAEFEVGQTIGVAGLSGAIAALEPTAVVLDTDDGRRVRVPNDVLLGSTVTLRAAAPAGAS